MNKERWSGAVTVETAIIMPLVLILLTMMMMFAMFIYEKVAMRAVCNQITAEGAAIWMRGPDYMRSYYGEGAPALETQERIHIFDIYKEAFLNISDIQGDEKAAILEEAARKRFAAYSLLLSEKDVEVSVELKSIFIHKNLIIDMRAEYNLPFFRADAHVAAENVISGQTEMIRTIDLVADLLDEPMEGISEKYGDMIDKFTSFIEKLEYQKDGGETE